VAWLDEQWPRLTFLTVFVPLHAADALSGNPRRSSLPIFLMGDFGVHFARKNLQQYTVY
jgi:hypothetical protein